MPDAVAPMELARRRAGIRTQIPLSAFSRLSAEVACDGPLTVSLDFELDEERRCRMRGSVQGRLTLTCQRCLEPVMREISADVDLCIVGSEEQAQAVAVELNPYVLEETRVPLADLVEDEFLLCLPSQVCGDEASCPRRPQLRFPAEPSAASRKNPFAVLRTMQRRDK